MPRLGRVAAGCVFALAAARAAGAQARDPRPTATVDVGATSLRWADTSRTTAFAITPTLRWDGDQRSALASGTWSVFSGGAWTAQGSVWLSTFTRPHGPWRAELAASAGGSVHQDGTQSGQLLALGRVHAMRDDRGAWLGGGAGRGFDGFAWRRLVQGELGAWARLGDAVLVATVSPAALGDSLRYTDAIGSAQWARGPLEGALSLGTRTGDRTARADRRTWADASATLWLASRLAVTASAGTYPLDPTQGFPGGRYASLALRLAARPRQPSAATARDTARGARDVAPDTAAVALAVAPGTTAATRAVRVHAPAASRVELAGDFTDWQPSALTRGADGWWTIELPLRPGTHQLNVRLDGGAWLVPRGATALADEFGGTVGIVYVP